MSLQIFLVSVSVACTVCCAALFLASTLSRRRLRRWLEAHTKREQVIHAQFQMKMAQASSDQERMELIVRFVRGEGEFAYEGEVAP